MVLPAATNELTKLYITHEIYLTPHRLQKPDPDFWNLIWAFATIAQFWGEVNFCLSSIVGARLPLDSKFYIFGLKDDLQRWHHQKMFL